MNRGEGCITVTPNHQLHRSRKQRRFALLFASR